MVAEVLRAPRLQFLDYWDFAHRFLAVDGSLRLAGWFELHVNHPAVTPNVLFWLNNELFAGSNRSLGLVNIALGVVLVVVLYRMLPTMWSQRLRLLLLVAFSALVFSSAALEMFGIAMSGTVLLCGLLPSVAALRCAQRGALAAAIGLGVLACLGHGVGFPVLPAVALVGYLRRDRAARVLAPLVVFAGVIVFWALLPSNAPAVSRAPNLGLDSVFAVTTGALSPVRVSGAPVVGLLVGAAIALALAGGCVDALRQRRSGTLDGPAARALTGWAGLGLYCLGAAVLIGVTRTPFGVSAGLVTRYATLPAVAAGAAVVFAVCWARRVRPVEDSGPVPSLLVFGCVATFAAGAIDATTVRDRYPDQRLLAVAMRVEAGNVVRQYRARPGDLPRLNAAGAYPFTEDFSLGCYGRELGERLPTGPIRTLNDLRGSGGDTHGNLDTGQARGDTLISGWALINKARPDCVLVVDATGTVVGGGTTDIHRRDAITQANSTDEYGGFTAVARPGVERTGPLAVLVGSGGNLFRVDTR